MSAIKNRYDFILYFDVENGNPNGDPDAGNMPRTDQETGLGLVTDVCLKRKVRNYIEAACEGQEGFRIYVHQGTPLEKGDQEACKYVGVDAAKLKDAKKKDPEIDRKLLSFMVQNFFDIRTFGAVMTTFVKGSLSCGQVRGPVQLGFARSLDPVLPQEVSITRSTVTTEKEAETKNTMMGRKYIVPYGLYRVEGYISANLARRVTGFSEEDLDLFWKALINMFDMDHSAARGNMAARKLIVFRHDSELGNAPASALFDRVKAVRRDAAKAPRAYGDYEITIDRENLPEGVTIEEML
ncbi:MAG: type I-C CRISPR-associated protein Cas7/Csd2 [Selenomonas sp.]|uniref:type I-C CRISPR-associated protein Cas7/Csd2 n=1 Tax=Selenomonas sp. TaxID=2053611 RepID=UPI0025E6E3B6|nr:type I-C CRISPR-associated protein Cas7/Csd2 [Selenomonas sp.]MCI6231135.1 type I-C CRISPR-associated protein Cas7/Csd2 [Selenomonas sp.]